MKRLLAFVFVLFCLGSPTAVATPVLKDASPPVGSRVAVAPQYVRLTFDRRVSGGGPYEIVVTNGSGEVVTESMIAVDEKVVTAPLRKLSAGEYTVEYSVKPMDNRVVTGQYRFTVGSPEPPVWVWILLTACCAGAVLVAWRLARR
ncbi:copper resistance protein CopC [Amycolatopsis sp. NPDC057786]|uniref:copper resistance CopC family protein n=1 Tax=Amycolatopsis sp. NPDC057786 TaxID=3346250 RepID=UPI00366B6F3D